jgi:hypothetical protein
LLIRQLPMMDSGILKWIRPVARRTNVAPAAGGAGPVQVFILSDPTAFADDDPAAVLVVTVAEGGETATVCGLAARRDSRERLLRARILADGADLLRAQGVTRIRLRPTTIAGNDDAWLGAARFLPTEDGWWGLEL